MTERAVTLNPNTTQPGCTNSGDDYNSSETGFNFDFNCSENDPFNDWWSDPNGIQRVMDKVNIYVTPVIILLGVTGNIMSFLVFATTHLRRHSSSVYLASLAVVDTAFLLSLLVVWLGWINVNVFNSDGWCQIVVYTNHVCAFLSVWNVVSFTAERYIVVWHPLRKDRFCTTRKAKIVVCCLTVISLVVYSFTSWTSGVVALRDTPVCMPLPQYYDILTVLTAVDTIITLIVPSIIIIVLNIKIIIKIHHFQQVRNKSQTETSLVTQKANYLRSTRGTCSMQASVSSRGSMRIKFSATNKSGCSNNNDNNRDEDHSRQGAPSENTHNQQQQQQRVTMVNMKGRSQFRLARMLLVVSSIFVMLNIPSHYFRIQAFVQHLVGTQIKGSRRELAWQELFQLVYYLNFAINFFLYSACGRPFRSGLKRLAGRINYKLCKSCKFWDRETHVLVPNVKVEVPHPVDVVLEDFVRCCASK